MHTVFYFMSLLTSRHSIRVRTYQTIVEEDDLSARTEAVVLVRNLDDQITPSTNSVSEGSIVVLWAPILDFDWLLNKYTFL